MIIGNKTDLHAKRSVTKSQGEALAKECGVSYIETSAKDGTNVHTAFQRLATDVVAQLDRERRGLTAAKGKKRGSNKWLPAGFMGKGGKKEAKRRNSADGCQVM